MPERILGWYRLKSFISFLFLGYFDAIWIIQFKKILNKIKINLRYLREMDWIVNGHLLGCR